ncbi:hypothetical protein [Paenisporosarcina antarctica]|uniref:DUF4364 family protein n=1 Tax=Paenisporosarcina antarctica TaxID=417367 RepID=A0A4P6ZV62_9BACL|nr:hypothetical protein [Paenisporosarcina antarctica]QBP40157.1 hypothetical protein E2636_02875 [Paenisporosarcina antarctica]
MDKYKMNMVLHYFNNVAASYSYNELLMIFGFQIEQLDLMLRELIEENLLKLDGYYKVTESGINELKRLGLYETEFENIEEQEIFTKMPTCISEIYIPKRFNKSFK